MATKAVQETAFGGVPGDAFGEKLKIVVGTVTMSASYTTGGETVDLSDEFATVLGVLLETKGGYLFEYAPGTGANDGKVVARHFDYAAAAAGAAVEVPATTNLSGVGAVRFIAYGFDAWKV